MQRTVRQTHRSGSCFPPFWGGNLNLMMILEDRSWKCHLMQFVWVEICRFWPPRGVPRISTSYTVQRLRQHDFGSLWKPFGPHVPIVPSCFLHPSTIFPACSASSKAPKASSKPTCQAIKRAAPGATTSTSVALRGCHPRLHVERSAAMNGWIRRVR